MGTTLIGLDGIERELAGLTGAGCRADHGLNTIAGYALRLTRTDGGAHRDARLYEGATSYGEAIEDAHTARAAADTGQYALVDCLYACGCRGMA